MINKCMELTLLVLILINYNIIYLKKYIFHMLIYVNEYYYTNILVMYIYIYIHVYMVPTACFIVLQLSHTRSVTMNR